MIPAGMLQKQFEQFDATCLCCATVPEKTMMSRTNKLQKTDKNKTVGGYSRPPPQNICFSIIEIPRFMPILVLILKNILN